MGDIAVRYRLRVKQRQRIVEYAQAHGIKPAGRHFGLDRRTVRRWLRRWVAGGAQGLVPRYPARRKRRLPDTTRELIRLARVDHRYGAARAQVWLKRVHHIHVSTGTIQRVFREIGIPVLTKTPKRRPRQMMLFEKEEPGDSVQVDVKVVKLAREKVFQYTAIDDCTRYRVLRLYPRQNQHTSLDFLGEVCRHLPFAIKKLQCDNGSEFPLAFKLAVEAAGMRHRYIKPRRPQQNGKVERSHRVDQEEFWNQHTFARRSDAEVPLADWERRYNHERFSMALHGLTPVEKLQAKQAAHIHAAVQ
jgi:transposase InsO family protein